MSDLALVTPQDTDGFALDIAVSGGDLRQDAGLRTAVLVSLFTHARAQAGDDVPDTERLGGWWGEKLDPGSAAGAGGGGRWGSRLWLLARAKVTAETLRRAEDYGREALTWLIEDRVAAAVSVTASELLPRHPARGAVLRLDVTIERPSGTPVNFLFDTLWDALDAL